MRHKYLFLLGLLAAACSDTEDEPRRGVAATIIYGGAAEGTLVVAAFTSVPPTGGPMGFAQETTPVFPATLELPDLPEGTFYVLGMLDVDPASPTQPGPEDLTVWSQPVEVVEGEQVELELTLVDP